MSAEEVARFIQHYERITHANINDLSKKANVLIKLGQDHQVLSTDSHFWLRQELQAFLIERSAANVFEIGEL